MTPEISQNNLKLQLDLARKYITQLPMKEITIVEYRTYVVSEGNDYVEYFIIPKTNTGNAFEAFVKLYDCQLNFWMAEVLTVDDVIAFFVKDIDEYCFDRIQASTIDKTIEWHVNCAENSMCGYLGYPKKLGKAGNIYVNNKPYLSKDEFKPPIFGTVLEGINLCDDAWNGEIFYETTAEYVWFVHRSG